MRKKPDAYPGLTVYRDFFSGAPRSVTPLRFYSMFEKVLFLRKLIEYYSRKTEIRGVAADIVLGYGVPARDYRGQAEALLDWVQQNIYFINEREESFVSPLTTLETGIADCDDATVLLSSLLQSIMIPSKLVILGKTMTRKVVTYTEGGRVPPSLGPISWMHVYPVIGLPPKRPTEWLAAEPTIAGFELGREPADYLRELDARGAAFPS